VVNREKGEVSVEINGRTYTLVKKFKACVATETLIRPGSRVPWGQIEKDLESDTPSAESVAAAVLMLMLTHQPDTTAEDVFDLFDQAGGDVIGQAIRDAFLASAPDPRDAKALGPRPRKARVINGTGANTSSPPVGSA
jgi:hypothetical protein